MRLPAHLARRRPSRAPVRAPRTACSGVRMPSVAAEDAGGLGREVPAAAEQTRQAVASAMDPPVGEEYRARGERRGRELRVVCRDEDRRRRRAERARQIGGERRAFAVRSIRGSARRGRGPAGSGSPPGDDREGDPLALAGGAVPGVAVGEVEQADPRELGVGKLVADAVVDQVVPGVLEQQCDAARRVDPPVSARAVRRRGAATSICPPRCDRAARGARRGRSRASRRRGSRGRWRSRARPRGNGAQSCAFRCISHSRVEGESQPLEGGRGPPSRCVQP